MRSRLVRFLSLAALMFSLQFLNLGCSSSSSAEGQEEEVAAGAEGEESANNASAEEEGQAAANNENNGAESNGLANNAEGGANNNQGAQQNAESNGFNNGTDTAAVAENNQGQQGGEEDLQQIIEEMNTANNTQLPPANNNMAAGMDNVGNAGNSAGFGNSAPDAGAMNQASSSMDAAAPAPSSGGAAVAGTPAGPGLPELGSKMSYIVQKGDTLAKIASRIYGDSNKWTEIANFTGLANPRLIYPGDVVYYQLTEQSMKFAGTYDSVKRSEVQIQQGDTLATIAGRVFGNSSLWKLIWRQNDRIDNPDRLTAGSTIYYVDPASMVNLEQKSDQEFVKIKSPTKPGKLVSFQSKPVKKAVYEVANDHLDDIFSKTVSKDLLKRT